MQASGAPGETENALITDWVTTRFPVSPCTARTDASFSRPSNLFMIKQESATEQAHGLKQNQCVSHRWSLPKEYSTH